MLVYEKGGGAVGLFRILFEEVEFDVFGRNHLSSRPGSFFDNRSKRIHVCFVENKCCFKSLTGQISE